jgi:hypothetical protein
MGKNLSTAIAIMAVLFIAAGTVSAQEKKKVEKKVMTIVTVDENGVKKDTTIISNDTVDFKADRIIIETEDGMVWQGKEKGEKMIFVEKEMGGPGMHSGMGMNQRYYNPEAREGVNYNISIDGVIVNIRAPKEKTKEADLILDEVRKILMKK